MKKYHFLPVLYMTVFFLRLRPCYCQKNSPSPWDSTLESNSEKWKLSTRQKMFGNISKLEFGPFSIASIEKLDSPVMKKKTKGNGEFGLDVGYDAKMNTGNDVDMDITKKIITQRSKYYRMLLAGGADTAETICSVLSITKDEKETVGGAVLKTFLHGHYSSEENKSGMIAYFEAVKGSILVGPDAVPWNFYFTLGKKDNAEQGSLTMDTISFFHYFTGYLKNHDDSLSIVQVLNMSVSKFLGKKDTFYISQGFDLVNKKGEHLAAYQDTGPDKKSPYIWMRNDINDPYRQAIVSFLAVIIYRKQYQNTLSSK